MPAKRFYKIVTSPPDCFDVMCAVLLDKIPAKGVPVRMVFFGDPVGNQEYSDHLAKLNTKVGSIFREATPPISYIAQKPLNGGLILELCFIEESKDQCVSYHNLNQVKYLTISSPSSKELIIGGVMADDLSGNAYQQATEVFQKISTILRQENMPVDSIYRQWNYLEKITGSSDTRTNYQEFNRARTEFYAQASWGNGYPAATGIGISAGGVIVEIEAIWCLDPILKNCPIDNDFQIPAHKYSREVLLENQDLHMTPKFERARFVSSPEYGYLYISGTAAVRGERSTGVADAVEQIRITMENIGHLVSTCAEAKDPAYLLMLIYLKKESDYPDIKGFMDQNFPDSEPVYLLADICREELLVEIETVVFIQKSPE